MLSANDMEKQVVIGTIIAPHGVRGDIRILPQTDHPEQFLELSSLLLEDGRSLQITSARFHKRMVLMKCRGVETMNDAELLRGKKVLINSEDLPQTARIRYGRNTARHIERRAQHRQQRRLRYCCTGRQGYPRPGPQKAR